MATEEQLASRKELADFIERMGKPFRHLAGKIKSDWFGRPDEELKGWIERGRAIAEIEDSMGYKLIVGQTDREIEWAREQLEIGTERDADIRGYLRALRFVKNFILTTKRDADISSSVLAGREGAIGQEGGSAFVKNARVEN